MYDEIYLFVRINQEKDSICFLLEMQDTYASVYSTSLFVSNVNTLALFSLE